MIKAISNRRLATIEMASAPLSKHGGRPDAKVFHCGCHDIPQRRVMLNDQHLMYRQHLNQGPRERIVCMTETLTCIDLNQFDTFAEDVKLLRRLLAS